MNGRGEHGSAGGGPGRGAGRILIVEDSSIARRAMESLFRMRGWHVASAATVEGAMAELDRQPDCILLDLFLPDGDGEQVLRRVREAGLPSRVIVSTGCHDGARLEALMRLDPVALLHKPLDFSEVLGVCQWSRCQECAGH